MALGTGRDWNWEVVDRSISRAFQGFSVRPHDDGDEFLSEYNGCGCGPPATAFLTVYAPGKFDSIEAQSGQRVSVDGREGFFTPSDGDDDAVLAWVYGNDAWATIRGRTSTTSNLERLLELARSLRPAERTPMRFPLSLTDLPAGMPLSNIKTQRHPYPTMVSFGGCQPATYRAPAPHCQADTPELEIRVRPSNDYSEHAFQDGQRRETFSIPTDIDGKLGHLHERNRAAAVRVKPGLVVEFSLTGPAVIQIEDVIAKVAWAPNLDDETTWPSIDEWTR
jgi:hypothetical protein